MHRVNVVEETKATNFVEDEECSLGNKGFEPTRKINF